MGKCNFVNQFYFMSSINHNFTILNSVDSTNNYAMAQVHAALANHGDAFFAHTQTGGKGQRGKTWLSGNGENIAISIIAEPKQLQVAQQFQLSVAIALGCFDFFSRYAGDETVIKWPNDIYWRDRKAGGVLIENVIGKNNNGGTSWKYAIIGIGLNINQTVFDASLKNVVSLKQLTGKSFDIVPLAKELQQKVLLRVSALIHTPFDILLKEYNSVLFKKDCAVKLKKGEIEFFTVIKSVTAAGQLYTLDRIDNFFDFGEVEWIL